MDSCQRFKEMVSDYIEGGLSQQNKELMDKHLRDCLRCKGAIKQLKNLLQNLKELPKISVSPDFETILRARISMESGLARRRGGSFLSLGQMKIPAYALSAVTIVALALFASLLLFRPDSKVEIMANMNEVHNAQKPVRFDRTTNEKYVYFIEKQPVPIINPQSEILNVNDNLHDSNLVSDSLQILNSQKNWHQAIPAFEQYLY